MRHNKKRNTGLLYEFLVQSISSALVESDERRSTVALGILKRHFKKGSHLLKELRLINSLVRTTVSSDSVATNILEAARTAVRAADHAALDREKSLLISVVNKQLKDPMFFDRHVSEYQTYGTVQTLFNDWRSSTADIGQVALREDQLVAWLKKDKTVREDVASLPESMGTSRLLMKVMTAKLNEKYDGLLNEQQKAIVKAYVKLRVSDEDERGLRTRLEGVKQRVVSAIDEGMKADSFSDYVKGQLAETRQHVLAESFDSVDDDLVTRFMLYLKLEGELREEVK